MYSENDFRSYRSDELRHHGILGMKWGRKNGPPYPLGASDHSASEKKAGWRDSLDGRKTANKKTAKNTTSGGRINLTDRQKTAIKVGAAAVGVALAAYGGYSVYRAVKTVDAGSMIAAKKLVADQLRREASQASASAKIGAKTGHFAESTALRSKSQIKKLTEDTIASTVKVNRNAKNIAKAAVQEMKNDVRDVKDILATDKRSPFRNPFMSPNNTNKVFRAKELADQQKIVEEQLENALEQYSEAKITVENQKAAFDAFDRARKIAMELGPELDDILPKR